MEAFKTVENLFEHVREYVNNSIALAKLNIAEKISKILSALIAFLLGFFILFLFIVFLSLAAAHAIGNAVGHSWLGFLIVSAFYLLAAIILLSAKEKIFRIPIMNAVIRQLFDENDKEHEKDKKS
jgi:hypothetical protein